MTDQRTDASADTSLDERVARALGSDHPGGAADPRRAAANAPAPVDLRDAEARPRRFGVRGEQERARERRVEQHELRLDALTNRLSGVALRLAALQAAAEGAEAARHDLGAELGALAVRVDTLATDLLDVAATHELGTKVLSEARADETARIVELEAAREEDRARLEALEEAVAALTTKARTQAGQLTKLRNQLKAATDPPPAPAPDRKRASGAGSAAAAKRSTARTTNDRAAARAKRGPRT